MSEIVVDLGDDECFLFKWMCLKLEPIRKKETIGGVAKAVDSQSNLVPRASSSEGNDPKSSIEHEGSPSSSVPFVNDYHIEDASEVRSTPELYARQIFDLQEQGAQVGGIGVQ
ncbi:Endo-1,4-beta-xylanase 1 [Linum perenne]